MKLDALTNIERRVLRYLHQHGGSAHRHDIVADLADPDSRIGRGILNGSNAAIPLIFGRWAKRLLSEGAIKEVRHAEGQYRQHKLTALGEMMVRGI